MALGAGSPIERIGIDVVAKTDKFLGQVDDAVNKGTSKFAGLAANVGKAMVAAGAVAGAAIAGVGVASTKMALDFEASIAEVKTLLPDLSEKGFDKIKADVLDLSKEMGITTEEMVPALYQAISAGVPPENVIDFLRVGAKASIGGVTDLATAVDGLTTIQNAFGYSADQTGRIADVLFTGVKLGKTTMEELSNSMFQAAPLAAALGLDIEDVVAATATLTKSGTPTSVAMTQIRQAMVALSKPTADMAPLIEATGFESGEALLQAEGFAGALGLLTEAAGGNKEVLAKAFGSVEALQAVLGLTGENAEMAAGDLAAMMDATGAADKAFETMADTAKFKLGKFLNLIRVEMTKLGIRILPLLTKGLDWAINRFEKAIPILETFAQYIGFIIKDGDFLNDFLSDLPKPLRGVAKAFGQALSVITSLVEFIGSSRTQRDVSTFERRLRNLPESLQQVAWFAAKTVIALRPLLRAVQDIAGALWDLSWAVAGEVWGDFVSVLTFLLDNVLGPLAETAADFATAIFGVGTAMGDNEDTMERVKDILVLFVEAWLALLLAKKVVTLTQNIVHTGATFIKSVANMAHTITQNISRVGAFFIDVVNIARLWTMIITQEVKRIGAPWLATVKDWTVNITQKITKIETKRGVAQEAGKKSATGFMGGLAQGIGIAGGLALAPALGAAFIAAGAGAVIAAAIAIAVVAVVATFAAALLFPEQVGMLAGAFLGLLVRALTETVSAIVPFMVELPGTLFGPFLENMEQFFTQNLGPELRELMKNIMELDLGGAVETGLEILETLFLEFPVAVATGLAEGFGDVVEEFVTMFAELTRLSEVDWGKIGRIFTGAAEGIATFFSEWGAEFVGGFLETFVEVSGVSEEEWAKIGGKITGAAQAVIDWFKEDFFPFFKEDIPAFFKGVGEAIMSGFSAALDFPAVMWGFISSAWTWLGQFWSNIKQVGSNIGSWIWEGIKSAMGSLGDLIPGLGSIPGLGWLAGAVTGRQAGGPLAAGEWAQVNERGMEFFRPFSSGVVMPTAPAGGAPGGDRWVNYGHVTTIYGPGRRTDDVIRDLDRMVS